MDTLAINPSGGLTYVLSHREALAKYAVTGTLQNTVFMTNKPVAPEILKYAKAVNDPKFVASVALYSRKYGRMRDMSVLLVAWLSTLEDKTWFNKAFDQVVDNVGQLRKFVGVIRSGVVGRKSLGHAPKRAIQRFFDRTTASKLFWQARGTKPSIADVIKLSHPKPNTSTKDALFAYFLGKECNFIDLPEQVQAFENFKTNTSGPIPNVPFERLTSLNLSNTQWKAVFNNMTWNQIRKNVNTAIRKGLFEESAFITQMANRIKDPNGITKSTALPMSLMASIDALDSNTPLPIQNAMKASLNVSVANAPTIKGNVAIIVDVSGSMGQAANGRDGYISGSTSCVEAAAFFAAAIGQNVDGHCVIVPVDTRVRAIIPSTEIKDTWMFANKLARYGGGGTNLGIAMQTVATLNPSPDLVIMTSDNESWADANTYHNSTIAHKEFQTILNKNEKAKLVCWNIVPNNLSQVPSSDTTMNIGGFTDVVFELITIFHETKGAHSWVSLIEDVGF